MGAYELNRQNRVNIPIMNMPSVTKSIVWSSSSTASFRASVPILTFLLGTDGNDSAVAYGWADNQRMYVVERVRILMNE